MRGEAVLPGDDELRRGPLLFHEVRSHALGRRWRRSPVREYLPIVEAVWTTPGEGGGTGRIALGNLWRRGLLNRSVNRADDQVAAGPRRRQHQDIVHEDQPSLRRRDPTMRTWRRTDRQAAIGLNAAVGPNRSNSRSIWAYPEIVCILMSWAEPRAAEIGAPVEWVHDPRSPVSSPMPPPAPPWSASAHRPRQSANPGRPRKHRPP
jgi:hypothetical protein